MKEYALVHVEKSNSVGDAPLGHLWIGGIYGEPNLLRKS